VDGLDVAKKMKRLLQTEITERDFTECWSGDAPPHSEFLDAAAERLSSQVSGDVSAFSAAIKPWGSNRVRIDGSLNAGGCDKTYYIEVVWLPTSSSYRGVASVRDTLPTPEPKSIEQFIADLDAIVGEEEVILEGQIFQALEGIDEASEGLHRAYPAIFRLLERFPEEESGMHNHLIDILEQGGRYEGQLLESIRRVPSIPAVQAAYGLLRTASTEDMRSEWLKEIQRIASTSGTSQWVADTATCLLAHYDERTNTEQGVAPNDR
jgi:hypothetical protein